MTTGYFFPYRPIPIRNAAPMIDPGYHSSRQDERRRPTSYNASLRTVDCIVATETPVRRHFGMEILKIKRGAVDLSLLDRGRLPILDSHDQDRVLGRLTDCWIENR